MIVNSYNINLLIIFIAMKTEKVLMDIEAKLRHIFVREIYTCMGISELGDVLNNA